MKNPIYILPHGIEVISEYPVTSLNRYARVLIRPHRFFGNTKIHGKACLVRKSHAVIASVIGHGIPKGFHVHHKDHDGTNDAPENLELITSADHNRKHKTGSVKSQASKSKVSETLKMLYREGKMNPTSNGLHFLGKKHTPESKEKIRQAQLRAHERKRGNIR